MKNFYYGTKTDNSFDSLLTLLSGSKPHSEKTSTLPLAQYWNPNAPSFDKNMQFFANHFKCLHIDKATKTFEYPTPVIKGAIGKSSMTDLMIEDDTWKIAVEAKYTEVKTGYESIAKWRKKGKDTNNRDKVLEGWFQDLGIKNFTAFNSESYQNIPYQFLHRAASACHQAINKKCAVVYMIFQDDETKKHADKFVEKIKKAYDTLQRIQDCKKFEFEIIRVDTKISSSSIIPPKNELGMLYSQMGSGKVVYNFSFPKSQS